MNAKERLSGNNVVQGCFLGGDDSILRVFSWEPQRVSKSHDQPGRACALALA